VQKAVRLSIDELLEGARGVPPAERDEMAVPSYCHWNPAIRWLFWRRLDVALDAASLGPDETVLDFGCGSGVLLPSLCQDGRRVMATDLVVGPAEAMIRRRSLAVELVPARAFNEWAASRSGTLDCILALDVLEHLEGDALPEVLSAFAGLLRAGGHLIVSGPTETFLYKIGRMIAGFVGDYHHRTIFDIDRELRRTWARGEAMFVPGRPLPRAFLVARYARN